MINFKKYTPEDKSFAQELLENSFPPEERPDFDILISRSNAEFNFQVITENDENHGIIGYWEFDNFIHIEHFAIHPDKRNGGVGGQILDSFFKIKGKLVVLEVEAPTDELSSRRIKFYERHGMHFNDYHYMQPSYQTKEFVMQQYIMSTKILTEDEFLEIKKKLYRAVYELDVSYEL